MYLVRSIYTTYMDDMDVGRLIIYYNRQFFWTRVKEDSRHELSKRKFPRGVTQFVFRINYRR